MIYTCDTCESSEGKPNKDVMKTSWGMLAHLRRVHGLNCEHSRYEAKGKFFCCGKWFRTKTSFLHHVSEKHNIHIWYEKGISKKVVYLDGI